MSLAPSPRDLSPPHLLGRFVLRRRLGASERGVVYKAIDPVDRGRVALKVLRVRSETLAPDALDRWRGRVAALAALDHPNLCRLRSLESSPRAAFVVRDYIRGQSLADWLARRGKARDIRRSVTLIWKAGRALAILHEAGMMHGRVRPGNLLLDAAGEPRLADADLQGSSLSLERETLRAPSAYLAPEQVRGGAGPIGPPADVYSLGMVMHRLITGVLPDGNPPLFHRPDLDPVLEQILKQALAGRPQDRFADGRAFAAALDCWLRRQVFC